VLKTSEREKDKLIKRDIFVKIMREKDKTKSQDFMGSHFEKRKWRQISRPFLIIKFRRI